MISQTPPRRYTGDLIMLGTAMLMGSSYPFAKDVLQVMSPLLYSGSRYVIAGLFLLAMLVVTRQPLALSRRDWLPMIVLSVVSSVVSAMMWTFWALRRPVRS